MLPGYTPGEGTPGTHWAGGWVGPSAGMDTEAGRKFFRLCRGWNTSLPVVQSVVRHYID
jgi:hypothetical protein